MADKTVKYEIDYSATPGKINGQIDQIIAKLTKLDQLIDKTQAKLKAIGNDMPGVKRAIADLAKLDAELKHKVTDANAAERALKDVGKDNKAITALTARVQKLKLEMEELTAAATAAKAAAAGVGSGGGGGGGPVPTPQPGPGGGKTPAGKGKAGLGSLVPMAVAAAGQIVRAGFAEAGEGAQKGRDYFTASTGKVEELRDRAREYASLRKQPGANDQILREITGFAKATGATPEDAVTFLNTYEGSATTGRDKGNIGGKVGPGSSYTQKQQDDLESKLKVVGGQFAMATGLDARTAGDLTAVISTYKKINTESDLAGQLAGAHYGIDQGRGEIGPLARSELAQAGSAIQSGRVSGLPELGAFVGVASVISKSPGASGTTYGQISRLLNDSGMGNEKQEQFVKDSGMGAATGDLNKAKALRDHLAKVKPADANTYLEAQGYGNSTDRKSMLGTVDNINVLEERIKKANEIAGNGTAAMERLAANQKEIGVVGAKLKANDFAVDVEAGLQNERLDFGRTAALTRLKDPTQAGGPRIYTPATSIVDAMRTVAMAGSNSGEAERIDEEAIEGLARGGKQVGVDVAAKYPKLMRTGITGRDASTDTSRRELFSKAYDDVVAAGGDPFGGAPQQAAKALRAAADKLDALGKANGGGGGGGGGGGRTSMPPLPNGSGVNPGRP
jgi:hypothetical protein